MKKYTKIYFAYFGYSGYEFMPCEICGSKAVDVHHIHCKGMGGSNDKDTIENLMGLCRICHDKYGDRKQFIDYLKEIHFEFMGRVKKVINKY